MSKAGLIKAESKVNQEYVKYVYTNQSVLNIVFVFLSQFQYILTMEYYGEHIWIRYKFL